MIIKNNYNTKNVEPLSDYDKIGKGSHSLDNEFKKEKEGFIRENMNNPVLRKLRGDDKLLDDEEKKQDKWDFFR